MLTIIVGGVRSGKSTYAEKSALQTGSDCLFYIATSVPTDQEMEARIRQHQEARHTSEGNWETKEYPTNPSVHPFPNQATVLLDCVTTWATNEWMAMDDYERVHDVRQRMMEEVTTMEDQVNHLFLVSNDVFSDALTYGEAVEEYLILLGTLHQELVKEADHVIKMEFGLPQVKKGGDV